MRERLGQLIQVPGKPHDDPCYQGLILHDLRRSAISNLMEGGASEKEAMEISGHLTRSVFDRYHIVRPEVAQAAMKRLENLIHSVKR